MHIAKKIGLALGVLILAAVVIVYGGSEWIIRSGHAVPLEEITLPKDAASIAEGGRIAKILGCRGCHNDNAEGSVWPDPPWFVATVAAPGIARKIATYSDAEVLRLIRHGIRKDGSAVFIMPAGSLQHVSDDDAAKVIAWLRTVQPTTKDVTRATSYGPLGRLGMLTGQFTPNYVIGKVAPKQRPADLGRYYYDTVCSECHNINETKVAPGGGMTTPALNQMATAYSPEAFRKLMRTGVGMSGRDLGLMREVAVDSGSALTDAEITALQEYLKGEGARK